MGEGYRRLSYMMMDADLVAVSPTSLYRVLKAEGLLRRWNRTPSSKGEGFQQPIGLHERRGDREHHHAQRAPPVSRAPAAPRRSGVPQSL